MLRNCDSHWFHLSCVKSDITRPQQCTSIDFGKAGMMEAVANDCSALIEAVAHDCFALIEAGAHVSLRPNQICTTCTGRRKFIV